MGAASRNVLEHPRWGAASKNGCEYPGWELSGWMIKWPTDSMFLDLTCTVCTV